ncbi:hypothetical protein D3C78_1079100 [compost metagenome]
MNLRDAGDLWGNRRNGRTLERTGGDHHMPGLDHAIRGFNGETGTVGIAFDFLHVHAGTDRRVELAGVGFEVLSHLLFPGEGIRVQTVEFQPREAVVPGRAVGYQRIPATGAPGFGDTIALHNEVRHTELAQVFTHGHAGLAGANNKRINFGFINCHGCALLKGGLIQVGHGCRLDSDHCCSSAAAIGIRVLAAFCSEPGNSEIMFFVVAGEEKASSRPTGRARLRSTQSRPMVQAMHCPRPTQRPGADCCPSSADLRKE